MFLTFVFRFKPCYSNFLLLKSCSPNSIDFTSHILPFDFQRFGEALTFSERLWYVFFSGFMLSTFNLIIVFKTSASDVKNCILRVPSPALNRISFSADDGTLEDSLSAKQTTVFVQILVTLRRFGISQKLWLSMVWYNTILV